MQQRLEEPKTCNLSEIGLLSRFATDILFIEDDTILLGAEVTSSGLTTHSMMQWNPLPSEINGL